MRFLEHLTSSPRLKVSDVKAHRRKINLDTSFDQERSQVADKRARSMPSLGDVEAAVVASAIVEDGWWDYVHQMTTNVSDLFWDAENRMVARALDKLHDTSMPITRNTVIDTLSADDEALDRIDDIPEYVVDLIFRANLKNVSELQRAVSSLQEYHERRTLLTSLKDAERDALDEGMSSEQIAGLLRNIAANGGTTRGARRLGAVIDEIREENGRGRHVCPTGLTDLDRAINGWEEGRLYMYGARPKVGKSTLLNNHALSALQAGWNVLYVSLEMSPEEVWCRMVSGLALVDQRQLDDIYRGASKMDSLSVQDRASVADAEAQLRSAPIDIMEARDVMNGADSIISAILKTRASMGDDGKLIVIVDYLGLMVQDNHNVRTELANITRKLKLAAQTFKVPILLAVQLNRGAAEAGGMPMPHQLRDSGSIEQDADVIMMVHRPFLDDESEPENIMDIWVALCRYAPSKRIKVSYLPEVQTIADLEGWDSQPKPQSSRREDAGRKRKDRLEKGPDEEVRKSDDSDSRSKPIPTDGELGNTPSSYPDEWTPARNLLAHGKEKSQRSATDVGTRRRREGSIRRVHRPDPEWDD